MKKQFLTCVFKIHNPTAWKRNLLNKTIEDYTKYTKLLLYWCKENESYLEENGINKYNKYTAMSLCKLIPYIKLDSISLAPVLKESCAKDVSSVLASYFSLKNSTKQDETGFPAIKESKQVNYELALDKFVNLFLENSIDFTKKEFRKIEEEAKWELQRTSKERHLPVHYIRQRDFTLLTHKERMFVYLKLTGTNNQDNLQTDINGNNLINIATGEVFNKRAGIGVLFPIELGETDWQGKFIFSVLKRKAEVKIAKLIRKDGEFYLHISFSFDCPDVYEPKTYLGIDRGVFFTSAYGIVDNKGKVILKNHQKDAFRDTRILAGKSIQSKQRKGRKITIKDYKGKYLDSILHKLTNELINLALEHKSMIVLENLNIQIKGKFYKSAWVKFHNILSYKCTLAGVPFKEGGVWAAYTSKICINCGEIADRPYRDYVNCTFCGYKGHADESAAINIARRALYKKTEWGGTKGKPGNWRAFHKSFANLSDFETKTSLRKKKGGEEVMLLF